MARAPKTLIEHVYARNRSFRETAMTTTFVVQWAFALRELRVPEMTMKQYVEFWKKEESQAKAYRRFESFRKTFPDHPTPNLIAADLVPLLDEKLTQKNFVADAPLQKIRPAVFA